MCPPYHEKCFEENWWANFAEIYAWLQNVEMMNIYGFCSVHLTCLGDNNAQIFTEDNCHSILIITKTLDHIIMCVHHYRYLMYYSFIFHVLFVLLSRLPWSHLWIWESSKLTLPMSLWSWALNPPRYSSGMPAATLS